MKGRSLASPTSREIRPTADRLRESLFNILLHAYDDPILDARVLDLFAGTGALGIEAISRGAKFTLFVDNGTEARALLRNNVEALGLGGVTKVYWWKKPKWRNLRRRRVSRNASGACMTIRSLCF